MVLYSRQISLIVSINDLGSYALFAEILPMRHVINKRILLTFPVFCAKLKEDRNFQILEIFCLLSGPRSGRGPVYCQVREAGVA